MKVASYLLVTLTVTIIFVSSFLIFRPEAGYWDAINSFRAENKNTRGAVGITEENKTNETGGPSKKSDQGDIENKTKKQEVESTKPYLYIAITSLSIATLASVLIAFYLYRWRKLVLKNQHYTVPEQFGSWVQKTSSTINTFMGQVNMFMSQVSEHSSSVAHQSNQTHENINKISEMFLTLQKALDEKDSELKRYKNGYDAAIFLKFLSRFIRTHQAIEDMLGRNAQNDDLLQIKKLLEDALEECGVETFHPEVGSSFSLESGVADNPKTVATTNVNLEHKIASIISCGYKLKTGGGEAIITPAKVMIYKISGGEK